MRVPRPRRRTGRAPSGRAAGEDLFRARQRARRLRLLRRAGLAGAGLVVVIAAGWLVFFSPYLAVQGATVTGVDVLDEREVQDAAQVPVGEPLARADLTAIQARVEGLAPVRSADIGRGWPDHVSIEVTERTAVAALAWEGQWRGMDADGVLFRTFEEKPEELPEVRARVSTPVEALAETAAVVDALPAAVHDRLRHVEVSSIDDIVLHLRGGARVRWGSADNSADKGEVLLVLLDRKAQVYDVTAPGRPTLVP